MTPASVRELRFCPLCRRETPVEEMAHIGDQLVCPFCKGGKAPWRPQTMDGTAYLPYAGFWVRLVAAIIDGVVLLMVGLAIQAIASFTGTAAAATSNAGSAGGLLGLLIGYIYDAYFVAFHSATPGKMVMGLEVVSGDGSPVSFGAAAGRGLAKLLSGAIFCIGYIMVAVDGQKRGLHDRICETRVIHKR
jgi:uncharacterized RDD family membrane protein YckC